MTSDREPLWRSRPSAFEIAPAAPGRTRAINDFIQLSEAIRLLEGLGFPSLGALRIPEAQRLLPVRNVRLLRDRYTSFDLSYELGMEREIVAAIAAAQRDNADNG